MKSRFLLIFCLLFCVNATWQLESLNRSRTLNNHLEIDDWELIGSRTYDWEGKESLKCKHWDRVAIRWHLSSCDSDGVCTGGSNVDYATNPQNHTEMPVWRNAFTFVQLPGAESKIKSLRFGLHGYDRRKTKTLSFAPLKIDVDWRWQIDKHGCNIFAVRVSAMSVIDEKMRPKLEKFCRDFDKDKFIDCHNL